MNISKTVAIASSEQLQNIFRQAQQEKTPVYLYRKPGDYGISLDLSKWNEVEEFDADNLMIIVPPGILLSELNELVTAKGLRFIPADSPYLAGLSVGEWVYRGCPNVSSWKYGAGKHFLLGSSYVFPNGEITDVGGKCIKNVSGYDLTRFLAGAYADFAVGVRFVLKLMPQPVCRQCYDVTIRSLAGVNRLVSALHSQPVPPAWLYWADAAAGSKLFAQPQAAHRVIFELDGNTAEVNDYAAAVDKLLIACHAEKAALPTALPDVSQLEEQAAGFWLLDEFKVPYPAINEFAEKVTAALAEFHWNGGLFGQLANGKIHLYVEKTDSRLNSFIARLQTEAAALGGAASGKYERVYGDGSSGILAVIEKNFKQQLDPAQIFNPAAEVTK
ncbi:putative Glycolate oxidase subunit GlcD [uncultured Sporomusa sp.]|uniref:Putative Glycolate oxidase subunit GlcD n=1 Tax=uncultured Sporomusa sp. TaxID=307249 RepID=A0A212M112_9FIRM|nr:FAD-binding oxidoreductase [uncultured Sporomusa sp.]SCM83481.1 putative Glycolate oxidase subunit GlcD [uncultured Sporomusa sp.]